MPPSAEGSSSSGKDGSNFRARRLSVSKLSNEFSKSTELTPGRPRHRRLSMSPEMGERVDKELLAFDEKVVGTFSCHGVEPGRVAGETTGKINQDRGAISFPCGEGENEFWKSQSLFCVYDGHGSEGAKVSEYVAKNLPTRLEDHADFGPAPEKALIHAFEAVNAELKASKTIAAELSGTTAVVILIRLLHSGDLRIWSAWTGDSRAVIATKNDVKMNGFGHSVLHGVKPAKAGDAYTAIDITEDHKPNTPAEEARIRRSKGFVSPPEEEWGGPARVWVDAEMTIPGLAMSRSIGDLLVKDYGVTATPDVIMFDVPKADLDKDPLILLCSDGVWEFISSEQAIECCLQSGSSTGTVDGNFDCKAACTKLIERSAQHWRTEEGDYRDDITAILLQLKPVYAVMEASN